MKVIFLLIFFLSSQANALLIRPEVNYRLAQDYQIKNIDTSFESQGFGGGFSLFFNEEKIDLLMGTDSYQWLFGMGIEYSSLETKGQIVPSLNLPAELRTDFYKIQTLFGLAFYSWRFEIPISLIYAQEKTEPINNDEKYGWGTGFQILYSVLEDFSIGASYEYAVFEHGKNASTGQNGTLSSDISILGPRIFLTYNFYWSSF